MSEVGTIKAHCFFKKLWIKETETVVTMEKRGEISEWTISEYGFRLRGEGC